MCLFLISEVKYYVKHLDKNVFFVLNKVVEIVFSKMKLPRSIFFFLPRFLSSFLSLVAGTLRVA